jgi:ACR3 family arsenite efflux pump ArsB
MMELIQTLLVFLAGTLAFGFLVRKYLVKKKSNKASNCSSDCACH